ncbi:MAG: RNA polymerase subunit sigma-24, partial [Candidatus Thiodiazotropha taylori]|nr:RNA polymerase subunit sigma-24 [Candidatus Thiodiazotropha taylori]
LVLAGQSTGSPQLDSFGPDLKLANVLLKKGQREAVAKYLSGVKRFWEMDEGRIDSWLKDIEAGKTPKLSRFRR